MTWPRKRFGVTACRIAGANATGMPSKNVVSAIAASAIHGPDANANSPLLTLSNSAPISEIRSATSRCPRTIRRSPRKPLNSMPAMPKVRMMSPYAGPISPGVHPHRRMKVAGSQAVMPKVTIAITPLARNNAM